MHELALPGGVKVPDSEKAPKPKAEKMKDAEIPWKAATLRDPDSSRYRKIMDRGRIWTPAQPPPGPRGDP